MSHPLNLPDCCATCHTCGIIVCLDNWPTCDHGVSCEDCWPGDCDECQRAGDDLSAQDGFAT